MAAKIPASERASLRHSKREGEGVITIGTSVPVSICDALDKLADERYVSRSVIIREALVSYLRALEAI
jgi:metal-responsive CopG/Arc/MetJ family transcriptional regulator